MDRLIYTALTAMRAQSAAQAVTANNLANAGTPGFRRELSSVAARWLDGGGDDTRAQADDVVDTAVLDPGTLAVTARGLDVAIDGPGWFAVQAADGGEAYSRRGDFQVTAAGVLETGDGHPLLGANGPITLPSGAEPVFAADGSVSVGGLVAGRLKLVSGDLAKRGDGLFGGAQHDADPAIRVRSGLLEGSNVDTAGSLVELLEQSRAFETSAKLLRMTREIDESGARLMRLDN
ncbi:flagellar basal body rod protein FlgF [Glacieibacterium sp.]|uniref:flagellar basal body rod protein FlgF n=1 Tax=Glacieibacterium sp. TaxID=2860237 RepID=UPI003B00882C